MEKISVGVIGATGIVGQNYIRLLDNHPWFDVQYVAASSGSAGTTYEKAVKDRWHMKHDIPANIKGLIVEDANKPEKARGKCRFIFSALKMEKEDIINLENRYAELDIPVVSNNSAHRSTVDVPVLISEVNHEHIDVIQEQQKNRGWKKGFIVVKPNCSVQSYLMPVHALRDAGFEISRIMVTTLQSVSGAGYPGVSSMDIIDNVYPLPGEETKSENEPLKILGKVNGGQIVPDNSIRISAHCNRVPVLDGHTACVSIEFGKRKPDIEKIIEIWSNFKSVPQKLNLPSAPLYPIVYRAENDRPQPVKDRDAGNGMSIITGRLRRCKVLDIKFIGLSHNIIRGAAGGGILNTELLAAKGFFE
ncbi:MAG: aspartate-semialdehyde dehydrogenase [Desulfobacteraceae bacterium]|jgi:aspartate-semialdehyde dehydrogenase